MNSIFIDNFRGFSDTLLPLETINFFVGENSTGKTSLLKMIYLLNSPSYWMLRRFSEIDNIDIDLGNFSDMVSMHSKDKKFFHIGAFYDYQDKDDSPHEAFLASYIEKEGMPLIKKYSLATKKHRVDIKFQNKRMLCRISPFEISNIDQSSIKDMFLQWRDNHISEEKGFRENKKIKPTRNLAALNGRISALFSEQSKDELNDHSSTYGWPNLYRNVVWMAPIRTRSQDIYTKYGTAFTPEGHHTPYVIKTLLESEKNQKAFKNYLTKFGINSGLFDIVKIKKYGQKSISPFELDVTLSGRTTKITNVGYGVSQILPIIVELFAGIKGSAFIIQQPEIHLHPRAQAAIGDVIYDLATNEEKHFIVETHSDFLMDRFRLNLRNQTETLPSQIVFFQNSAQGNTLQTIKINEDGELPSQQPEGFRDFFLKEELRILGL